MRSAAARIKIFSILPNLVLVEIQDKNKVLYRSKKRVKKNEKARVKIRAMSKLGGTCFLIEFKV